MAYDSDLSGNGKDFEAPSKRGNGHKHSKKLIVDAILYVLKGGGQYITRALQGAILTRLQLTKELIGNTGRLHS